MTHDARPTQLSLLGMRCSLRQCGEGSGGKAALAGYGFEVHSR